MVRQISREFPKGFKFKITSETCQGLPHHCHDHSSFTHHTLSKIYRLNKPPGQYLETVLPSFVWEEDRNFKIQLVIVSVCRLSTLCCPKDGSGLKITILNLLEVCSVLILHNLSVQTQTVGFNCKLYRSPLLSLSYRKVVLVDCSCHNCWAALSSQLIRMATS